AIKFEQLSSDGAHGIEFLRRRHRINNPGCKRVPATDPATGNAVQRGTFISAGQLGKAAQSAVEAPSRPVHVRCSEDTLPIAKRMSFERFGESLDQTVSLSATSAALERNNCHGMKTNAPVGCGPK